MKTKMRFKFTLSLVPRYNKKPINNEINNAFKFALRSKFPSKISEADVYAKK